MGCVRRCEHLVALCDHLLREAVVDLVRCQQAQTRVVMLVVVPGEEPPAKGLCVLQAAKPVGEVRSVLDRKSTRLNSSHVKISYAVFCLKKKKKTQTNENQV